MKDKTSQYYDSEVGRIAHYLAKFGSAKANEILLEVASENKSNLRVLIVAEMNRQLNPELLKKMDAAIVPMISIESIETFSGKVTAASGIKINFEKDPASEKALCQVEEWNYRNGIPCTYSDGRMSVLKSLEYLFGDHRNQNYTWIIDGDRIRVLPVEIAIDWWRKNHLRNK